MALEQVESPDSDTERNAQWTNRIDAAIRAIDDRISLWQGNADKRKSGRGDGQTTQVAINKDWPLTKAKIAQLYSQTPEVRLSAKMPELAGMVPQFAQKLNETIGDSNVGATVEECLADAVNASGIAFAHVSCEKLTEWRQVPQYSDPMIQALSGNPMLDAEQVTDIAYPTPRLSPADGLVDTTFTGSDYDQSRWIGRRGSMTWSQALRGFKLNPEDKDKVLGSDRRRTSNSTLNTDSSKFKDNEVVNFSEVYYWRHYFHPEETSFKAIQHMVFVDGLEDPVIDEEYTGQKRMGDGTIIGMTKFPIRVLTLTYVSDESLPPSDSTIARAQVNELEQIRGLEIDQRRHSLPIRWYDPTRLTANGKALIDKGDTQQLIPVIGGDRAIGEVSRASFPAENIAFEDRAEKSLQEIYQVGSNQAGTDMSGEKSATEARVIQQNFQTRVGQERDKVAKFFVGIAECLAGLMVLHGEYGLPEEIAGQVTYSVRTDSAVRLNAEQRIDQLMKGLNMTAQSGFVNAQPIIAEIWELLGVNPENHRGQPVVVPPKPKPPEPVNISGKAEDLLNPVFLAHSFATGQGPTPEHFSAAVKLLQEAQAAMAGLPLLEAAKQPTEEGPPREPETPGMANPGWEAAPRVERRDADGGA